MRGKYITKNTEQLNQEGIMSDSVIVVSSIKPLFRNTSSDTTILKLSIGHETYVIAINPSEKIPKYILLYCSN